MQLFLSLVFLVLALCTGANVYILKSTLSNWAISILSVCASVMSAWTAIYYATRFIADPAKIIIDTSVLNMAMAFANHAPTDPIVFGNLWLIAVFVPLVVASIVARELRKVPRLQPQPELPPEMAAVV